MDSKVGGAAPPLCAVPRDRASVEAGGAFEDPVGTARAEWRRGWLLVVAGLAGMSISGMAPYSLGLFMDPLTAAFGWSRGLISSGLTLIATAGILLTPFVGMLSDRFGPRAVAVPGLVLASAAFAAFGLNTGSPTLWLALWGVYGVAFVAAKPLVWSAAISRAFDRSRGLALAVTLSGVAVSQTLTPIASEWLIRTMGWRSAFCVLGLVWGGVVLLVVLLFFRIPVDRRAAAERSGRDDVGRPSWRHVFDANIAKIALSTFLLALIGAGVTVHKVPILGEFGIDRLAAARLASTAGVAGIAGKLAMGWLMDRFRGHAAGAFGTGVTGLGIALLLPPGHDRAMIVAAMLVLGFGAGASLQVTVYLVSRFAPAHGFGRTFGAVSALTAASAGLGPWLFGAEYSAFRSYGPALDLSVPVCLLAGILLLTLDPLPERRT